MRWIMREATIPRGKNVVLVRGCRSIAVGCRSMHARLSYPDIHIPGAHVVDALKILHIVFVVLWWAWIGDGECTGASFAAFLQGRRMIFVFDDNMLRRHGVLRGRARPTECPSNAGSQECPLRQGLGGEVYFRIPTR